VFLLESHAGIATLHAWPLRAGCGLGRDRVALRIGRWQMTLTAAVSGDEAYVARDRRGIRRLPLAG
jgi:hypothetical protein